MIVSAPWAGAIASSGPSFLPGPLPALPAPIAIWEVGQNTTVMGGAVDAIGVTAGYTSNALCAQTPLRRPAYSATGGHGGKPAAIFGGSHSLYVPALELPVDCKDITVAMVSRIAQPTSGVFIYELSANASGTTDAISVNAASTYIQAKATGNVGENARRFNSPAWNVWKRFAFTTYKSDPNPEASVYQNNAVGSGATGATADNTNGFASGQPFFLGARNNSSGFVNMAVTEIHIYPKLTPAQLTTLDNYLTSKYPAFP